MVCDFKGKIFVADDLTVGSVGVTTPTPSETLTRWGGRRSSGRPREGGPDSTATIFSAKSFVADGTETHVLIQVNLGVVTFRWGVPVRPTGPAREVGTMPPVAGRRRGTAPSPSPHDELWVSFT